MILIIQLSKNQLKQRIIIRLLVLTIPKLRGYARTFNNKDEDRDKNKNNKLMYFHVIKFIDIFLDLNVPEDGVECESLTIISIDSSPVSEKKYYLQVQLDHCACKNYGQANNGLS